MKSAVSASTNWTASDLQQALLQKAAQNEVGAPPEILSAPTSETALAATNYVFYYDPDDPENPDDIKDDDMYQILMTCLESLTSGDGETEADE